MSDPFFDELDSELEQAHTDPEVSMSPEIPTTEEIIPSISENTAPHTITPKPLPTPPQKPFGFTQNPPRKQLKPVTPLHPRPSRPPM